MLQNLVRFGKKETIVLLQRRRPLHLKIELTPCVCPKGDCSTRKCGCYKTNMPCTILCACNKERCENTHPKHGADIDTYDEQST